MDSIIGDAFGAAVLAYMEDGAGALVLERDDGWVDGVDAGVYFREPADWPEGEAALLDLISGRVLDIGAGPGRYSIELQKRGHTVTALDTSPGAIEVCRQRGVARVFVGTIHDLPDDGVFDTYLLGGHNLGLLESPAAASAFLRRLHDLARPGARIVGTSRDPHALTAADHVAYHRSNLAAGRAAGHYRYRVRRARLSSPWFDYWYLAPEELGAVADSAGWQLADLHALPNGSYAAVLDRQT